ncbi:MBL fold metallo-hydrolase [Brevibacillus sp. SYSU BS000544]|uniref:MBL fold metallo-hydrolase n=1 Tax=Brevibacillus sp. SYSU BS000544 TaxID=3416443 RepID=UPI003CE4E7F8
MQLTLDRKETGQVAQKIVAFRTFIVNVCIVELEDRVKKEWVLVDAGTSFSTNQIVETARKLFGPDSRPEAIVLTHGHFDHVGALLPLIRKWDVPVYAHELEIPFLTGQTNYPPADPMVGGGLMAFISPMYPRRSIDLGDRVRALPADGRIPFMPGWHYVHTPGHTPGHISLFRDQDRVLLSGDAIITVRQESAWAVLTQRKEIHGPPKYFTPDWKASKESVEKLAALQPSTLIPGHGLPMAGDELTKNLRMLVSHFEKIAVPRQGRYV